MKGSEPMPSGPRICTDTVWWVELPILREEDSPFQVSAIELEQFELMVPGDPRHLYSIWDFSPGNILIVTLCQEAFQIMTVHSETEALYRHLNLDKFYMIRNMFVLL